MVNIGLAAQMSDVNITSKDINISAGTISQKDYEDIISSTVGKDQDIPEVPDRQRNITISIETIVMSALIFIAILSWFEFLRVWFDNVFSTENNYNAIYHRFWYAIFVTALAIVLLYIVYRISIRN